MIIDWMFVVSYAIVVAGSYLLGPLTMYLKYYRPRLMNSEDVSKYPDVTVPPEVVALISHFDSTINIRIARDNLLTPEAAAIRSKPAYIILPMQFVGQNADGAIRFSTNHMLAFVAHELGHIIPARQSMWLMELCASGIIGASIFLSIYFVSLNWSGFFFSVIGLVFALSLFLSVSRNEEYRADAFAITHAGIPASDLAEALLMLNLYISKQHSAPISKFKYLANEIYNLLGGTHPPIEHRILRMQTLYSEHR